MKKQRRSQSGQSILSEHIMIFFVVIAVVAAITVYVQRALQARIHDARDYVISSVANSAVCDANCVRAAGNITAEYEPYYTQMTVQSQQNNDQSRTSMPGKAMVIGAIYGKSFNEATQTGSVSCQQPPQCAGLSGTLPCYCHCPTDC